jgi:type IV secretion system protein VirB6
MNWHVFAQLSGLIQPPVVAATQNVVGSMISAVAGILQSVLAVYIALTGYQMFTGHMAEPVRDVWLRIAKGAFVVFLLTAGNYTTYVTNLVLTGIPQDISTALGGNGISATVFDQIWNIAFKGGLAVWKHTIWYDFGLHLLIVAYWFAAAIACVLCFAIWQSAQILLALFVAIGPLVCVMLLFNATRSVFERWIGALLGMLFLQVMVIVLLTVLVRAENSLLQGALATPNVMAELQGLFAPIIMFGITALLVWQLPGAATALAGGMHFHAYALHQATFGKAAAGASTGATALGSLAMRGASAGASGVARAYNSAVGRPLSLYGPP